MNRADKLIQNSDARAVAALIVLWLLFFWRLFTPIASDQASLAKGDFSGQFVAFGAYQFERMSHGEIPLWNPYNNGGLPFIADTQAAAFYPPRWLTIGLSALGGGWSYNSLQLEMTLHVLLYSLLMYLFVRRLTLRDPRSPLAAFCAAIIIGYGGYTTGYPPLQLAVLEAAIWLPLALLGVLEATRRGRMAPTFIALAGFGLGMSWLAGHPQTSWFSTYLIAAWLAYRAYVERVGWRVFLGGLALLAVIAFGVTAVTLLPGLEYLLLTAREELGFAAKGNGFPIRDIAQFVFPGAVSQWSPLFVGLPALFFAAVAVFRNQGDSRFWLLAAFIGLLHSLGENSAFYSLTYNFVPGLRFFRGQERAAFVVANSLAILAGLGIATATTWPNHYYRKRALRLWTAFTGLIAAIAILALFLWTADPDAWGEFFSIAALSALISLASLLLLRPLMAEPGRLVWQLALIALIAFELFSVNMDHPAVYDSVPHERQLSMARPRLAQRVLDDGGDQPYRVDGFIGLEANHASIYGLMDMRGISPLFLKGPYHIIHRNYVDNPLAWELFAVKYVFSHKERLSVPTRVIDVDAQQDGAVYLHRLDNPRPFARLYYAADVVDSDQWARELMDDPRYDEREKLVIHQPPNLPLSGSASGGSARVLSFAPEEIVLEVDTAANALLSLSLPDHPGWTANIAGEPVRVLRAYAGLSAIEIPAGNHLVTLRFSPASYRIGALISAVSWVGLALVALRFLRRR
ncbi:MAG: YfhO family protein [Chloroflexi bacterium]|nr:YfhO family protein [Chloroflexota bacterium]